MTAAADALRAAAIAGDWEACRVALHRGLGSVDRREAVRFARDTVAERLAIVERSSPGDRWARRALAGEDAGLPGDYAGPGANSLVHAVEGLVALDRAGADPVTVATGRNGDDDWRDGVVDVLADAVMATLLATWGVTHPQEWATWYAAARHPVDGEPPPLLPPFRDEPEIRRLERAQWEMIAAWLDSQGDEARR